MATSPAIVYLNVEVVAALSGDGLAYREVVRSGPIIDTPEDYFVAVSRAIIPLSGIPLQVGVMDPLATNGLDLVDRITISYNNFVATVPVRLLRQAEEVNTGPVESLPDGYTFIWSREVLAAMLSDALARATTALNAIAGGVITKTPFVSFDAATQLNTLTVAPLALFDLTGTESAGRANKAMIWLNEVGTLQWLGFSNQHPFPNQFTALPAQTADMWAYIDIRNNGKNWSPASTVGAYLPVDPASALEIVQGYPNCGVIALQTIQIRSSLPTMPELTDGRANAPAANVAILTDLRPDSTNEPQTYQAASVYVESGLGQLRYIKLVGRAPLANFSLSVWWVDRAGKARQVFCVNESLSVKLAFVRRSLVDNWAFSYGEQEETQQNSTRPAGILRAHGRRA